LSADIQFVVGGTGGGKSTYSKALAREIDGVHFAIDEWMVTLFQPDQPQQPTMEWMYERVLRVQDQMWDMSLKLATANTPPILEIGLTTAADRARFAQKCKDANLQAHFHVLDVPVETRWQRVEARNKGESDTFSFQVNREIFDYFEEIYDAPTTEEIQSWDATVTYIDQ
jgi:predicted kinase